MAATAAEAVSIVDSVLAACVRRSSHRSLSKIVRRLGCPLVAHSRQHGIYDADSFRSGGSHEGGSGNSEGGRKASMISNHL